MIAFGRLPPVVKAASGRLQLVVTTVWLAKSVQLRTSLTELCHPQSWDGGVDNQSVILHRAYPRILSVSPLANEAIAMKTTSHAVLFVLLLNHFLTVGADVSLHLAVRPAADVPVTSSQPPGGI